ncbi:methyl-accepting chemotaxis protein [Pseudomonas psychrotolerans]|nr:methyl-accepting chemotaxis protein [Pseudomonas psychrotolerans]
MLPCWPSPITELYPLLTADTLKRLAQAPGESYVETAAGQRLYAAPMNHNGETLIMIVDEGVLMAPLQRQLWISIAILAVVLGVSLLLINLLCSYLLRPLGVVSAGLQVIANGQGDLTRRIAVQSNDEVGGLAGHFNQFVASLHGLIGGVRQHAEDVDAESQNVLQRSAAATQELGALATGNHPGGHGGDGNVLRDPGNRPQRRANGRGHPAVV